MQKTTQKVTQKTMPRRLLYLQIMFTVIAFSAMAFLSYFFMSDHVHEQLVNNAQSVLDFMQSQVISDLEKPRVNLEGFSRTVRNMVSQDYDVPKLHEYFQDIANYLFFDTQVTLSFDGLYGYLETLPGGPVFFPYFRRSTPDAYNPVERRWYHNAIAANGNIAETFSYEDVISGETVLVFSICIFDDEGRRLGVIGQRMRIETIGQSIVETALARGGYGILLSDDLVILAHPNEDFIGKPVSDPAIPFRALQNEMLEGKDIFEYSLTSFRNEKSVGFFRQLPNTWYIGLVTPKDQYYKSVKSMAVISGILGLFFAAALVYILVRLDMARNKSDKESKSKSTFLANMSHEIRTPMNAILGITEIQLENRALMPETIEALEKIYSSGDLLLGIINDILDLSKIEVGKLELVPDKYQVASLINDTVHLNRIRYESKPVEFLLSVNEKIPSVLVGDELRIKQILNNLLSNAFKYTKSGEVELSVDVEPGSNPESPGITLVFRVRDTGQGLTSEQIARLFDQYARFNMAANRTTEGAGLGMSITSNLVRLMNGEITVASNPGAGSVFTVRLPQKTISSEILGRDVADNLKQFKMAFASQKKRAHVVRDPMPYGSVLVVDDTESNLYVSKGLLVQYRLNIETASSGFEAIEKIKNGSVYDIVFMDHMMPQMDGMEATDIIRKMGYTRPIVALTANAVAGQAEVFLTNGFDAFISKPIDIRQLNSLLNKLIRDKQPPQIVEAARLKYGFLKQDNVNPARPIGSQLIKSFLRDADRNIPVLEALLKDGKFDGDENLNLYVINIHGLKSALANIGEAGLSAVAQNLEKAGRSRDFAFIASSTPAFLEELKTVARKLRSMENENQAVCENISDEAARAMLREKLLAVKAACEKYDSWVAESIIAELQQTAWPCAAEEILDSISSLLLHSDFDEVAGVIERYVDRH